MSKMNSNTENGSESITISQEEVNNSNLYLDEKDSKGVPLLRRIEKYPDFPEDEFIPIEYCDSNGNRISDNYLINKNGQIKTLKTKKFLKFHKNKKGYPTVGIDLDNGSRTSLQIHRLVAFTFLMNPNRTVYNIVNHKNHDREDFRLKNLEFTTPADNSNMSNGNSLGRSDNSLINYIATDPESGKEVFKINIKDAKGFDIRVVRSSISGKFKYKGYIWKQDKSSVKDARNKMINLIGFSGNMKDYMWEKHWKYDDIYVCKEGYIRKGNRLVGGLDDKNYIVISSLKVNGKRIYTRAHRVLMEQWIGRDLGKDEVIDHIDGCPYNNNISNLRLTNAKGNINNPVTVNNRTRKLVLVDRFGDVILYGNSKKICEFVYDDENKLSCCDLVKSFLIGKERKYFCVDPMDSNSLLDKLKRIIYVVSSDTNIVVDSFSGIYRLYSSKKYPFTQSNVYKYLNSNIDNNGYYIICGNSSINILLKSGHLTALNYEPNKEINLLDCTVKSYEIINTEEDSVYNVNSRRRSVSRYDLYGNLVKTYSNICSIERDEEFIENNTTIYNVLSGKRFMSLGYLWCEVGNEEKIENDLKYIYYKFDNNGNVVDAAISKHKIQRCDNKCGFHNYNRYFNTGVPAPDGYYYQQGDPGNMLKDPENTDLVKKREIIKWKPKK